MIIRACCKDDITAVGRFYDSVVKYLDENINYPKWTYKKYPTEGFASKMTEEKCQFVCVEGDKIVGAFVLNDDPQGAYEKAVWSRELSIGNYMVCHALAVDSSLQGQGIGKQIVEYCVDYAKSHGFTAIRLDVVSGNIPAKKLYEKCGFSYVGDVDLERGILEIPMFSMYELNF